jgi:hypothetical protein
MKIAVSIPDEVFAEAESLAQRLKWSDAERVVKIPRRQFDLVIAGIDVVLGR